MIHEVIEKFKRMGADARVIDGAGRFAIDVRGGTFHIDVPRVTDLQVLEVERKERHLLLMVKPDKARFLCGHDERHWFVAAVPEAARASTVLEAIRALQPLEVVEAERRLKLKRKNRPRAIRARKNPARVRQGEWFFVPAPDFKRPAGVPVLQNEPIARMVNGRFLSRPHIVDEVVRFGGEQVSIPRIQANAAWRQHREAVNKDVGTGLLEGRAVKVFAEKWAAKGVKILSWQAQMRNALVYARGDVRHPDHKTIRLKGWHRVVMNTETQARAMADVAFID